MLVVIERLHRTTHQSVLSSCSSSVLDFMSFLILSLIFFSFPNVLRPHSLKSNPHLYYTSNVKRLCFSQPLCLCLSVGLYPAIPDMFQGSAPAKYGRRPANEEGGLRCQWACCPTVHHTDTETHTDTLSSGKVVFRGCFHSLKMSYLTIILCNALMIL